MFTAAVGLIYRMPADVASPTGIVIAGFGEADIFPSLSEYRVLGFFREKLLVESVDDLTITAETPGEIKSYASTSMVETFTHGLNTDTYSRLSDAYGCAARDLLVAVEQGLSEPIANKDELLAKSATAFTQQAVTDLIGEHNTPLVKVVSVLAIDEMANLAETLISLESLKEKVTRPTESVGGPVDIAAITKAEGLVWIKRKHYFDLTINPRYAARLTHSREQD